MKRIMTVAAVVLLAASTGLAFSDNGGRRFREFLTGLKEAPAIVSTTATGTFEARISEDGSEIDYVLTFQELEGDVRQAHIHIGHPQNAGGVVLWLCDSATNPSPSPTTPECTQDDPGNLRAGRVTGTLTAADVQAQVANGIAAGEWAEVVALIRAGKTYANLHTAKFGAGEIRSQIDNDSDSHDGHGGH